MSASFAQKTLMVKLPHILVVSVFSCWLNDGDSQIVKNANRRVEAVTGLQMATAEELQISNYGIGGHYEPHFDFARVSELWNIFM